MKKNIIWIISLLALIAALIIQKELIIISLLLFCGILWLVSGIYNKDKRMWIPGIVLTIVSVFVYFVYRILSMLS
jgi:hypothetical protein